MIVDEYKTLLTACSKVVNKIEDVYFTQDANGAYPPLMDFSNRNQATVQTSLMEAYDVLDKAYERIILSD